MIDRYDPTNSDAEPDAENDDGEQAQRHSIISDAPQSPTPSAGGTGGGGAAPASGNNILNSQTGDASSTEEVTMSGDAGSAPLGPQSASGPNRQGLRQYAPVLGAGASAAALSALQPHAKNGVDVKDLDPEFAQRLSRVSAQLDKEGYSFDLISGERSYAQQQQLVEDYKGTNHPVAAPGQSPHEFGCAVDFEYTGSPAGKAAFFERLHQLMPDNGLESVKNDINHCQIADARNYIAANYGGKSSNLSAAPKMALDGLFS